MPLATCPRCEKMFDKSDFPVCKECEGAEKEDYEKIADTVVRLPNLSAEDLAEAAEVKVGCVMRLVESGRIETTASTSEVRCGRCGAPAISKAKRLCVPCLTKLNAQLAQQQSELKLPEKRQAGVGRTRDVPHAVRQKRDLRRK